MVKLTPAQRSLLEYLVPLDAEAFHPPADMRSDTLKTPGAMLSRMAMRGLVQPNDGPGNTRGYRITPKGRKAIDQ